MGRDEPGIFFDEDKDLLEVWPQVVLQYEKITKQKLDSRTTFKSFEAKVDYEISLSKSKGHQHVRDVLRNIGRCLETFGSIIAQGASMVFGPASQCWNAISFVIQAARGFGDVLDGFVTLMERSSAFFKRLNHFLEQNRSAGEARLPNNLRRPAYDILVLFLDVLQTSYEVATSKREKCKVIMKIVLFNDDSGVASALELMERRIRDFTRVSIDEILLDVKGLARYLHASEEERNRHHAEIREYIEETLGVVNQVLTINQQMKITQDGRITKEQHKDDIEKIRRRLTPLKPGQQDSWDQRHDELCQKRVKTTGGWIERVEFGFNRWADAGQHDKNLFFLKGDSGFGKTYISNYIISHLQNKYRSGGGPTPVYVAYYYYGADEDESLEKCLGSVIYQFAMGDMVYAKAVADACGRPEATARAEDRWTHLLQGLQDRMNGIYFICIDGLDHRDRSDETTAIISAIVAYIRSQDVFKGVCLRLFVSGSCEALSAIPQDIGNGQAFAVNLSQGLAAEKTWESGLRHVSLLDVPRLNVEDIVKITKARIIEVCNTKPDLKGILDEFNPAGRANIQLLIDSIHGNYLRLEAKVAAIIACDTERKVLEVITNSSDDVRTFQRNSLKALDSSLDSTQIRVLNELLVWVSGFLDNPTGWRDFEYPSPKFLQSVLYFAMGDKYFPESEIATTYSTLLKIDKSGRFGRYGRVMFKFEDVKEILRTSSATDPDVGSEGSEGSDTKQISRAEVDLCRRFIKNACDSVDYTRFRFDDFFDALVHKSHIRLDDDNTVNVAIIRSCVNALHADGQDENLRDLRSYASTHFYLHIKNLVDKLDDFDPERHFLTDIGGKVLDLFYEPERIDAWLSAADLRVIRMNWLYSNDFSDALVIFLKNTHVAKSYGRDVKKREWVKSIVAEPTNKMLLLERVAAYLASQWFSSTTYIYQDYFYIPYGLVAKQYSNDKEAWAPFSATSQELDRYLQWAKIHVSRTIDSYTWQYRVGASMLACWHYEEAILAFEEAEPHLEDNWDLMLGLAYAHGKLKNFRTSLEYIQRFKALGDQYLDSDENYKATHWKALHAEADYYGQLQDFDSAVKSLTKMLSQESGGGGQSMSIRIRTILRLFATWSQAKRYGSIIDFVRGWKDPDTEDRGSICWINGQLHGHIIAASKHTGVVDEMCGLYQRVIDRLSSQLDDQSLSIIPSLQYYQAALRVYASFSRTDHDRGINVWETLIRNSDGEGDQWIAELASQRLAPFLLDKAIAEDSVSSFSSYECYASRLEALTKMNNVVIRRNSQGQCDLRLCLARLYHLKGNRDLAFAQTQERLCSVFEKWPEDAIDDSLKMRYKNLASTLTALDKDVDAIAAWQATRPHSAPESQQAGSVTVNGKKPASEAIEALSGSSAPVKVGTNEDKEAPPTFVEGKPKAYSSLHHCDTRCGAEWRDMLADCWVCRTCFDVQLCPACYKKLRNDELDPLICNKSHKLLYLPPFNEELWRTLPADMMIVDRKPVFRVDWINKLRDEYQVQPEQIDMIKIEKARELKARTCIARYVMRWRRRLHLLRAANEARKSGFPPVPKGSVG